MAYLRDASAAKIFSHPGALSADEVWHKCVNKTGMALRLLLWLDPNKMPWINNTGNCSVVYTILK